MKLTFALVMRIFAILLALTFIGLGAFILISDAFDYIPTNYKIIFAILMFAYGTFRIITLVYNVNTGNNLIDGEEE